MKIYTIELMGGKPLLVSEEDVAKLVAGTAQGSRLVLVGGSLINPASVVSVRRNWEAKDEEVEKTSDTLVELLGTKNDKLLS